MPPAAPAERGRATPSASRACDGPTKPAGWSSHWLTSLGRRRAYQAYSPAGGPAAKALVLHYHGWLDSSGEAAARSGLPRVADESGAFHAVFPEGAHDVGAPAGVWALALCGLGLLLLGALCLCCACRRARAREAPPGEGLADESIEFSGCASRGRHEESSESSGTSSTSAAASAASATSQGSCSPCAALRWPLSHRLEAAAVVAWCLCVAAFCSLAAVQPLDLTVLQFTVTMSSWNANGTGISPVDSDGNTQCSQSMSWRGHVCYESCFLQNGCAGYGCQWTTCVDDVAFFDDLISRLEGELCFDLGRVFVTGFSNGGILAYTLAMARPDRIAGAAPTAGSVVPEHYAALSVPVPLLEFHGRSDTTVPGNASEDCREVHPGTIVSASGWYYWTTETIFATVWRPGNGCTGPSQHWQTPFDGEGGLWCQAEECPSTAPIIRCSFDGGHEYSPRYADVAWDFLSRLPARPVE